jgi:hypothetical protein
MNLIHGHMNGLRERVNLAWRTVNGLRDGVSLAWRTVNGLRDGVSLAWRTVNGLRDGVSLAWRTVNGLRDRVSLAWRTVNGLWERVNLACRTLNAILDGVNLMGSVLHPLRRQQSVSRERNLPPLRPTQANRQRRNALRELLGAGARHILQLPRQHARIARWWGDLRSAGVSPASSGRPAPGRTRFVVVRGVGRRARARRPHSYPPMCDISTFARPRVSAERMSE